MSECISLRSFSVGDESDIIDILKSSFPDWSNNKSAQDYWNWKYRDAPFGSTIIVAVVDEKVVGVGHRLHFRVKIGDLIHPILLGDDFATSPEYRGKGVYNKIMDQIEKQRAEKKYFLISITANPIVLKNDLKRGRILFPHNLIHMIRVRDVRSYIEKKKIEHRVAAGYLLRSLKLINKSRHIITKPMNRSGDFKIKEIHHFNDDGDAFWESLKGSYNFIMEKRNEYLNWRYCDPRGGKYFIEQATSGDKVLGFVVMETKREGDNSEGYVDDLIALPGRLDVAESLMRHACAIFDDLGVNAINFKVVKGQYHLISDATGFIAAPNVSNINVTCDLDGEANSVLRYSHPNKVYFNYGDYL